MTNGGSQRACGELSQFDHVSPPQIHIQINLSNSEPRCSFLGNRDGLIKKVEMQVFDGENTFGWIAKVERFFRIGAYSEEEKLIPKSSNQLALN